MADIFDPDMRSQIMSKIKSRDTKPELAVRKFLFSKGFRYRVHVARLPGKPDIVLPKYGTIVLVHGCFWHGHDSSTCIISGIPKTNVEFWTSKISRNMERDARNIALLKGLGWKVLVVWECALSGKKKQGTLERVSTEILEGPSRV